MLHAVACILHWLNRGMQYRFPGLALIVIGRLIADFESELWYATDVSRVVATYLYYQDEKDGDGSYVAR